MARKFSGTILSGGEENISLLMKPDEIGFQISTAGLGTLTISTLEPGLSSSIEQTTLQDAGLIFDLMGISVLKLSAAGGDLDYTVRTRNNLASTPGDNWDTLYG